MLGEQRGGHAAGATTALAGLLMMLTWGSSAVATKVGLDAYEPGQLTLLRFLVTSAALALYAGLTRMRPPARRDILPLIGLGIVGITTVDPGTRFVLNERLTGAGWLGIGLTVVGTTVLVLGQGQGLEYTTGALILLVGAFSEAWYYILQKPFLRRYSGLEVSTWALIASTMPLLIFLPGLGGQVRSAPAESTGAVVYVALGAGLIGYVCMSVVNARMPAAVAAVLMAGLPPVALVTAWVWLGDVPPDLSILGGMVSLAGVLLVTLWGRATSLAAVLSPDLRVPAVE